MTEQEAGSAPAAVGTSGEHVDLPEQSRLADTLRPLRRRWRADPPDAAQGSASVPPGERWFREAVVITDDGPTMIVWRETVAVFARMLEEAAIFDRVTQWRLAYGQGPLILVDDAGLAQPMDMPACDADRRLIFLVSDCVSWIWRQGAAVWNALEQWGQSSPVVLIQTMPSRLWSATGIGPGLVTLFGEYSGNANRLLRVQVPWWWDEESTAAIGTPVAGLEESTLGAWANMLMAVDPNGVPGVIRPASGEPVAHSSTSVHSPRDLVRSFAGSASEPAAQLAVLLSAVEIDLTIARIILRALVPEGTQVHLAEVLTSGLLRLPDPGAPESFDFIPGVRDTLQESISKADALAVWSVIAGHLEQTGRSGELSAVLDPSKPARSTMAAIASALATKLGIPPLVRRVPATEPATESPEEVESASAVSDFVRAHDERRDREFRTRLLARAMGDQHDRGWWFCGRRAALAAVARWLERPKLDRTLLVVTGDPGSGKSAVLGLVATLARTEYRTVAATLELPATAVPPVGAFDVAIYAQQLTVEQIRDGIAAAAAVEAATIDELVAALAHRPKVLTVLIDAIDESLEPRALIETLLRPLTEHTDGRVRLLAGTRRSLVNDFGGYRDTIDLDSARYADPLALIAYVERRLRGSAPHYAALKDRRLITAIATAVAEQAERSFLVARIVADTLSADPAIPDPDNPVWRDSLPRVPGEAMAKDLRFRLGKDADRARDLLRPLAFAQGQGLPDKQLWAPLATRIAGVEYTDDDLSWLLETSGSYVIASTEAGQAAYRLHHQALADYLADEMDHSGVHRDFVHVLRQQVPTHADGTRDWSNAHPYTISHLAAHAAHAKVVDDLVTDIEYLTHAEPTPLLAALNTVVGGTAQLISAIYHYSASHHRRLPPAGRRQILAVDAARFQAEQLQRQLNGSLDWPVRWATGSLTHPAHRATFTGHAGVVTGVACARVKDRPLAVTSGHDRTVRVWDIRTGAEQFVMSGHTDWVSAVACTKLHRLDIAVTTGYDLTVRIWDLSSGTQRAVLTGHTDWVTAVACTHVGHRELAVTASRDNTVRIWDLSSGTQRAVLTGHTDWVTAVACTHIGDRPVAVTAGRDNTVRIWDLADQVAVAILTGHTDWVSSIACARLGDRTVLVTTSYDGTVRVWESDTGVQRTALTGHTNVVTAVACSEIDGPVAVTTSYDRTVRVWDLLDDSERAVLTGHTNWVSAVACADIDGRPIAFTTGWDDAVRMWSLSDARPERQSSGHTDLVIAAAVHRIPGHTRAVTAGRDGVRVWDLDSGAQLAVLSGHTDWATGVACTDTDDCPVAITTSRDNSVRVWNLVTATVHRVYAGHTHWVNAVACTHIDGRPTAVTASRDDTVQVWDLRTGALRSVLRGHTNPVSVATIDLDGEQVAVTAGDDRTVRVWDLRTGAERAVLTGHTDSISTVACTSIDNEPVAITAGFDRTVRIWNLRTLDQTAVIDCPTPQPLVAIGPGNEIVLGLGDDIAVLSRQR